MIHRLHRVAPVLLFWGVAVLLAGCSAPVRDSTVRPRHPEEDPRLAALAPSPHDELWIWEKPGREPPQRDARRGPALLARESADGGFVSLPLRHTDVEASISGPIAAVELRQQYENPLGKPAEAVYVMPLPQDAAVTDFVMTIGRRRIRGIVRHRSEARRIYDEARARGYAATLLSQERGDYFMQRLANLEPGQRIDLSIKYFHTLTWSNGRLVWGLELPVARTDKSTTRPTGASLSVAIDVDRTVPLESVDSPHHKMRQERTARGTRLEFDSGGAGVDRDFAVYLRLADEDRPASALLGQADGRGGGHFLMVCGLPIEWSRGVITDLEMDFGAAKVSEVVPERLDARRPVSPVVVVGRCSGKLPEKVVLRGRMDGKPWQVEVFASPTTRGPASAAIAPLWARRRINALCEPPSSEEAVKRITALALEFGLPSAHTAMVSVDATHRVGGVP